MRSVGALCADCKDARCQKTSREAINLLIKHILKGGVPLFEERGTALIYTYSLILSFNRAYK